jgi:methionyl-tRNA formyltransferase
LMEGDEQTGVGIMAMEPGLDTGPVLLERSTTIQLLDNAAVLAERLSLLTAELFVEALPKIEAAGPGLEAERLSRLAVQPQPDAGITLARLLTKDDYRIDWSERALAIHRKVMGLFPGAHCSWRGKRLKLLATEPLVARLADQLSPEAAALSQGQWPAAEPGSVLESVRGVGLVLATSGCPILLRQAQLEGKAASSGDALIQQLS